MDRILIFGLTSWDSFPQREHGLARELARQGKTVDVIEMPRSLAGTIHGILQRMFTPLARDRGFASEAIPPNVRIHRPPMLPTGFRNSLTPALDRVLFRAWFASAFRRGDFSSTVALIMHPLWWGRFLGRDILDPRLLVYDIADSLEVQSRNERTLSRFRHCEHELSHEIDVVSYSAHVMLSEIETLFPGVRPLLLPNAVSREFIDRLADTEHAAVKEGKEIGFIGSTDAKWFDDEVCLEMIDAFPECTVSIIGPVDKRFARQCALRPNVRLHGFVLHENLHEHLRRFDVAVIPFRRNRITSVVNPLKLYEYAAAGLPVVATWTEELSRYHHIAALCKNTDDFLDAIRAALNESDEGARVRRREFASANTWTARVQSFLAMLDEYSSGE
jgi:glycosyltransferase involved in cell wall biosynthesis